MLTTEKQYKPIQCDKKENNRLRDFRKKPTKAAKENSDLKKAWQEKQKHKNITMAFVVEVNHKKTQSKAQGKKFS